MDTEAVQDKERSRVLRQHPYRCLPSEWNIFLRRQDSGGETWRVRGALKVLCNLFEGKEIKEKEIPVEELRQREAEYEAAEAELDAAKRQAVCEYDSIYS